LLRGCPDGKRAISVVGGGILMAQAYPLSPQAAE
jgi:hypothetical protein